MKNKFFKKGFTLIEMLIVIAIIAILSSVFLVGLRGFRAGAYDARRISDLQKIQSYLESVYNVNQRAYPDPGTNWAAFVNNIKSFGLGIESVPQDPVSGNTYVYCVDTQNNKQSYILGALLSTDKNSALKESYRSSGGAVPSGYSCNSSAIDCSQNTAWMCVRF